MKWDKEKVLTEALKYTRKIDFAKGSKGAYVYAKKHNIFDEACKHMPTKDDIKKDTLKKLILESNNIHENMYIYDKYIFKNKKEKSIVTCPLHGDFKISMDKHINRKQGCPKCGHIKKGISYFNNKKDDIINRMVEKFPNIHINTNFSSMSEEIIFICKEHGEFIKTVGNLLQSTHGCNKCAEKYTIKPGGIGGFTEGFFEKNPKEADRDAILYMIKFNKKDGNEQFYKVGITTRDIRDRFAYDLKSYDIDILETYKGKLLDIFRKEQEIHNTNKEFSYVPNEKIVGYTECYTKPMKIN